jgi:hypothetical protein
MGSWHEEWGVGLLDAWSEICVDGGGASLWLLIPAIFRVDADVLSSPTWEMQIFSFSWQEMSILRSFGIRRRVVAYFISIPVFWRHTIFASSGCKKFCPSWHGLLCTFRNKSFNRNIESRGRVQHTSHSIRNQKIIIRTISIGTQCTEECSRYLLISAASNHQPSWTFIENGGYSLWDLLY